MPHLVITGGNGTLASAIAAAFTCPGWRVEAPDRSELDVSDGNSISSWFSSRNPDLLVCCAGMIRDAPLASTLPGDWDNVVAVNYQGAAACAAAVIPSMTWRGSGHIIFISSRSAVHPPVGQAAYATAKAALLGLSNSLAQVHGHRGIRVNAILPGFLETKMTAAVSPGRRERILADHALPAFNTPGAAAGFVRYLHDHLPHTSGQVFQLDSRAP